MTTRWKSNKAMIVYLDNAATSFPKPDSVVREVSRCLCEYCGNPGRSGHPLSHKSAEQIYACRCEICSFFHYRYAENIVFCKNASEAINLALEVYFHEGSHILFSDLEHNAVRRKVLSLCKAGKVTADTFSHKGDILQNLENALTPTTKTVVCTEASNVTGFQMPIESISRLCQKRGIDLIIDGAQGAGHCPTNLDSLHFTAYCSSAHKGLYGIQGLGFAILNGSPKRDFLVGGTGFESFSEGMPSFLPERFEAGTLATPCIVALKEGLIFLKNRKEEIENASLLACRFAENLENMRGITVLSEPRNPCGIVSFLAQTVSGEVLAQRLSERGVCTRAGYHCAPTAHLALGTEKTGLVRASFGIFNGMHDVRAATDAVQSALRD